MRQKKDWKWKLARVGDTFSRDYRCLQLTRLISGLNFIFDSLRLSIPRNNHVHAIKRSNRNKRVDRDGFIWKQINQSASFFGFPLYVCVWANEFQAAPNNDDTWQSSLNIQRPNISCSLERKRPQELLIKLDEVSDLLKIARQQPGKGAKETEIKLAAANDKRTKNVDLLKMNL